GEAKEASKRRKSMLDYRIQQLSKGSSEGSGIIPEIQSMVDVPIHQEDPAVQRTLLIDTVISMLTEKTASTPTPPTTQAQVQMYEAREKEAEPIIGVAGTRFGIYKAIISPNCPSPYLGYKWTSDPADEFDERVGAFHIVS
ncbi:hypothetical protein Tco_1305776, partial [Tanacetum coccineum]